MSNAKLTLRAFSRQSRPDLSAALVGTIFLALAVQVLICRLALLLLA